MSLKLQFLGAAGTVTGSKYLLTASTGEQVLVDCGLFQGLKQLRLRNWRKPEFDVARLKAVVLTHAHIDHSGYLPALVKAGFRGPVYCTAATRALCQILLPDSGFLQEEDARLANAQGFSRHQPALPLYTREEAVTSLKYLQDVPLFKPWKMTPFQCEFVPSGHILGAASVYIKANNRSILFSGDLGRPHDVMMPTPTPPRGADFFVVESTYGDRVHSKEDAAKLLATIVNQTAKRRGVLIVPSFAVARAQVLMVLLHRLMRDRAISKIPLFLDSPMAQDTTDVYCRFADEHKLSQKELAEVLSSVHYVSSPEESKGLDDNSGAKIIIAASGMATGGRVLHHLKVFGPNPRNTILFVGYQAPGTRGATLLSGNDSIKIHGQYVTIKAEIQHIDSLSAHADAAEIVDWLKFAPQPPQRIFLTHGESVAADELRKRIERELRWNCYVPELSETVEL
jgi:metallo-beta-lactamase family protein